MYRAQKQRKYIIVVLSFILIVMSGAYAAFQSNLKIKGTTRITSLWDVRITNVTAGTPTGSAENAIAPTWDKLIANMEANLYEKGDAMEYDVTITNNGTVDAILSDIIGTPSNSEAVIITFSGYAKGEKLYKKGHEGNTKVVHVKIAYNPEYDGGETSGEANVEFNFTQGEGGDIDPGGDKYLIAYNYTYNGGASSQAVDEYVESGTTVTLNKTASKPGWTFVGWNTNKNATTGLASVVVSNNTTVYAIYSKTLTATYQKSENVESISKTSDSCTIYNLQTGCNKTLPTITPKPGYTSDTWYNGTEAVGHGGDTYELKNNVTLTTAENTNKYQVVYNYSENGGTSATKTQDSVDYNANIDLTPTATKAGWTFVGWNTDKDACSGLGSLKMGTADVTLYAIYRKEAVTLTAKFNANGATLSSTANKTCTLAAVYNKATQATSCDVTAPTITAPANTPTVVGFNTSANATTNNSSYNASTGNLTLTASNDNKTWYAITKKDAVVRHITFNPNGNTSFTYSGTRQTATKTYDLCTVAASYNNSQQASTCSATITIPTIEASSNTPTLIGWSNSATNRTAAYTSGQSNVTITASSDLTYYAQTTKAAQTFTLSYSKGTGVSTMSKTSDSCTIEQTYNGVAQASNCAVTLPTFTVENGYTKDGFYNGNTKAGNDNTPISVNSNLSLTAKATANIYEVTLDGGDVQQVPSKVYYQYKTTKKINNVTCYYYTDSALTTCLSGGYNITPPSKDGYVFGGYYTGENGSGTQYVSAAGAFINNVYQTVGNKTLHAKWTANTYNINYTLNGGTKGTNGPTSGTYDSNVQISNPTKTVTITGNANGTEANVGSPTSANQTFAGWTSANLGENAVTGTTSSPATPWDGSSTKNTYFKNLANSGSVTMVANWTPVTVKLPTLSKEGYACKWYTEATGGTEMGSGGDDWTPGATSGAAVTAYARCSANSYTVVFNANDENAEGTMSNQTYEYDEEKKLTKNAFTKTGYTFKGWATSASGSVVYTDEQKVSNLVQSGTINLFAVWRDETDPVITATNAAGSTNYLTTVYTVNAASNKTTGTFSIKVGATDAGSGLSKIEYVIDQNASNPSSGWTETTDGATLSLTKEFGTYYLHIKATDNDGNISYATTKALTVRYAIAFRDYSTNTSTSQTLYATPASPNITTRTPNARTDYTFLGWYTSASGGSKVADANESYTPTKTTTLYGHWQKNISKLTIEMPDEEYVYDGTAKTPTVVVKDGSTVLTLNTHYTVSYEDNVNAGEATLTVTMKNAYLSTTRAFYTGTKDFTFTIAKSPTTTSLNAINKTYNGSAQAASGATSKLSSNNSDITGGSYTYTYYNGDSCSGTALSGAPKDAGTYSVKATLTGTGNYLTSTSECATYTMAKKKATINVEDSSIDTDFGSSATNTYTYDGDGTVTCSSSDSSKVTCAVDQTNKKITVTPIAATDTPVTITVSASDGSNYSAPDDKTFTVTIGRKTVAFPTCSDKTYTAAEQILFSAHTSGGYTNDVLKGTAAGNYDVVLTLSGNYKWSSGSDVTSPRTLTCKIVKSGTTTTLSNITKTYNGSAQAASGATSKLNSNNSAISGGSYTYTYYNGNSCSGTALSGAPKDAGTYSVKATLTGTANYNTSTSSCATYTMNAATPTVSLTEKTGMKWTGNVQAANNATVTLVNDETYTGVISYTYYTNNTCSAGSTTTVPTLAGNYWVKARIEAEGNYNAAASSCVAHTISVATPTVSLTPKTAAYSGSAISANTATVSPNSNPTITYTYYTNNTCTTKTGTTVATGSAASAGAAPKQVGQWYVIASAAAVENKTVAASSVCTSHKINQKKATITLEDTEKELVFGTNGSNTYTYDGDGTLTCASSDTSKVTCTVDTANNKITVTPIVATSTPVTITVSASDGTNYSAPDDKTFTVTVGRKPVTFPTCSDKTYTAAEQTLFAAHTSGGYTNSVLKGTNVNSYTVSLTPTANYKWSSGSNVTSARNLTCKIVKSDTTTTVSNITKTYNGSAQAASGATSKLNSNNSAISGGSYTYTYYNGNSCSGTALSGAPKDAGTYSVKATLTGTANYNTSTSSCATYTMNKKPATLTVTKDVISLTPGDSDTNTYSYDGDGTVSCTSGDTSKVTCSVNQTTKKVTVNAVALTSNPVTITVKATAGDNYSAPSNVTFGVTVSDESVPIPEITTTSTLESTSQTATLKCSDDVGVVGYYWGTTAPTSTSTYTSITSTKNMSITKTVNAAGTYYLSCKDSSGNTSQTPASKEYNSYTIKNLLQKVNGSSAYTTDNYDVSSDSTYIAPNGTTITMTSVYAVPSGSNSDRYKGVSIGNPSTTAASVSKTNPILSSNSTYSAWFTRNEIIFKYKPNGGTVTASTTNGTSTYTWATDSNNFITLSTDGGSASQLSKSFKYGANTINIYNYNNDNYLKITKANSVAPSGAEWICDSGCATANMTIAQGDSNLVAPTGGEPTDSICNAKNDDCTVVVKVNWKNSATIPTAANYCQSNLVYTGSQQTVTKTAGTGYSFTGNTGTNAGSYTVTATLASGYVWNDGSIGTKTFSCSIAKKDPTITLSDTSGTTKVGTNLTFNEKADVAGVFTNTSGTTANATVSPATTSTVAANTNSAVTVTPVKFGTSTITVTFVPTDTTNYNSITASSDGKKTYLARVGATATFDANGATSVGSSSLSCYPTSGGTSCTVEAPTITRSGYTIIGWSTNKDATSSSIEPGDNITLTGNATYYAITRTSDPYIADWHDNGATLSSHLPKACYVFNKATTCKVDAPTITRSGYTVIGYNTSSSATTNNAAYDPSTKELTLSSSGTWYAITKKSIAYTVTWDANGSTLSSTDASSCYTYNTATSCTVNAPTITASANTPTVVGWNTSATATTNNSNYNTSTKKLTVSASGTWHAITKKDAVTLTAKWNANGSTLSSTANKTCTLAATYNGAAQATSCTVDAPAITAPANTPTVLGYNTSADANANHVNYNLDNGKLTLTSALNNQTWYAQTMKAATDLKATFDPNGNAGFTYGGTSYTTTTEVTICTVAATYNGAAQATSCSSVTMPTITAHANTPTVIGWSEAANTHTATYTSGQANVELTSGKTYYAQSSSGAAVTLTAKWNANGSTLSSTANKTCTLATTYNGTPKATSCTVDAPTITAPASTPTVLGFNTSANSNSNNSAYNTSTKKLTLTESSDNQTWYAQTKKDAVTLTAKWNANGATLSSTANKTCTLAAVYNGAAQATSCTVDAPTITAPANTPTVLGWNITAGANENHANSNYDNNKSTYVITLNSSLDNKTWYAQTKKDAVNRTITFYKNGNTNFIHNNVTYTATSKEITVCTIAATYNGTAQAGSCSAEFDMPTITAPSNTPTVIGWSDGVNDHTATYTSGEHINSLTMSSNISLYAQTKKDAVDGNVTFNLNGNPKITYGGTDYTSNKTIKICTIAAIYNGNGGNAQPTTCTAAITMPTITAHANTPTVIGWTSDAAGTLTATYESGQQNVTLTSGSTWYAQSAATPLARAVKFYKNGASSQTPSGGTASTASSINLSCTIAATYNGTAQGTTCEVTSPTITAATGFTALGYATSSSATAATWNQNTTQTLDINNIPNYYAVTKSSSPITITFNRNGATSQTPSGGTASTSTTVTQSCYRYNGSSTCNITSPTITRNGFTIIGYNTSNAASSSTWNVNTVKAVSANATYFAITSKLVTITFAKGSNTSAVGASSRTCTVLNNKSTCTVEAPTITSTSGNLFVGWSTTNGASTGTLPGNTISVYSDKTYYGNSKTGTPTYVESVEGEVVITYPRGCSSPYTCKYRIGNGSEVSVSTSSVTVNIGEDEVITATASDGHNSASSTHTSIRHNLYVSSTGNDTTGYGTVAHPYATISRAYSAATNTRTSTIYVMNNITQSDSVYMHSSKDIILTSSDTSGVSGTAINTVTRGSSNTSVLCKIDTGTLTINNLKFNGNNIQSVYGALMVGAKPTVELNSGVQIYNFKTNNPGGGITSYLDETTGATITLNGASVSSNYAPNGGGIYVANGTKLIMNGNSHVSNNSTSGSYGGSGGGIYGDSGSNITINNGIFYENGSSVNGGAIYTAGTLSITGGSIEGNGSADAGAIYATSAASTTISGGTIGGQNSSYANTASNGTGAIVNFGTFNMTGGTISYNTGTRGGAMFNGGTAHATITGGSITNNSSTGYVDYAGGVFNSYDAHLTIGGTPTINNNTAYLGGLTANMYANNLNNDGRLTDNTTGYWNLNSSNTMFHIFSKKNTNFVLDVDHGTVANGTNVDIWTAGSGENQNFVVRPYNVISGKIYYVICPPGYQTVNNYGNTSTAGTSVKTWEWASGINGSLWSIESAGSGYWYIKSYTGSLCLDIAGGTPANGTDVDVWTCSSSSDHQKWAFAFIKEYRTDTQQWYNYRYTQS